MNVFKVKWEKVLEVAIKRLFLAEKAIKEWQRIGGGNMEIFNFLNIEGNSEKKIPPHPIKILPKELGDLFTQAFGEPIQIPKNIFVSVSLAEFLDELRTRRELYRECVGFTNKTRFRNKFK